MHVHHTLACTWEETHGSYHFESCLLSYFPVPPSFCVHYKISFLQSSKILVCVCNIILKTRARGEVQILWSCTKETWDRTVEKRPRNKQEWAGEEWGKERQGGGESTRKKHYLKMLSLYLTLCMPFLKSNHSIRQLLATYLIRSTKGNPSCWDEIITNCSKGYRKKLKYQSIKYIKQYNYYICWENIILNNLRSLRKIVQ